MLRRLDHINGELGGKSIQNCTPHWKDVTEKIPAQRTTLERSSVRSVASEGDKGQSHFRNFAYLVLIRGRWPIQGQRGLARALTNTTREQNSSTRVSSICNEPPRISHLQQRPTCYPRAYRHDLQSDDAHLTARRIRVDSGLKVDQIFDIWVKSDTDAVDE